MSCDDIIPYLEAFVDDELSPERTLTVRAHLAKCPNCLAEVNASRLFILKARSVMQRTQPSADFLARLESALDAETGRHSPKSASLQGGRGRSLSWATSSALAAAAALVLALGIEQQNVGARPEASESTRANLSQLGQDSLVDLLVHHHARPAQPEVTDSRSVTFLEPELGFPIHPPNLDRFGAHFEGANLIHVDRSHAASLHYKLNGHRVTLYVYNPDELPLRTTRVLHPTVVGNRAVFVGKRSGYSIATCEREGIGYAVAADLSDTESAELVAALDR